MHGNAHRRLSLRGTQAGGTYSEEIALLLRAIGISREGWKVERASEVEWEDGVWVARLARPMRGLPAGAEIARASVRAECIALEVRWLEMREFPLVVAGPLVRHDTLLRSLWTLGEAETHERLEAGTLRLTGCCRGQERGLL